MNQRQEFYPPRKAGILLHAVLLLLLLGGISVLLVLVFSQAVSWLLVFYLLGIIILSTLLPLAAYRGYALLKAGYTL